jgi:hypothetical protein
VLYDVLNVDVDVTLWEDDDVVDDEVAVEVGGAVDVEVLGVLVDWVLDDGGAVLLVVVVETVETVVRVARKAPPAMTKIITTTTTIKIARETAWRLKSLECNFLLRLEYCYLCLVTSTLAIIINLGHRQGRG